MTISLMKLFLRKRDENSEKIISHLMHFTIFTSRVERNFMVWNLDQCEQVVRFHFVLIFFEMFIVIVLFSRKKIKHFVNCFGFFSITFSKFLLYYIVEHVFILKLISLRCGSFGCKTSKFVSA